MADRTKHPPALVGQDRLQKARPERTTHHHHRVRPLSLHGQPSPNRKAHRRPVGNQRPYAQLTKRALLQINTTLSNICLDNPLIADVFDRGVLSIL